MCFEKTLIESDAHWHDLRSNVIGSSDIAALFGMSMYKSKFTLWHEKAGWFKADISSKRVDAGNYLENAIGQMVADKIDLPIEKCPNFYKRGVLGATPDFLFSDGVLEIKNMDFVQYRDKCPNDIPPAQYVLQLQHQLHCTGRENGILAILVGGNDLKLFNYQYRPKMGEMMERKAEAFFHSIKMHNAPAIDDPADLEVMKQVYNWQEFHVDLSEDNEAVATCHDLYKITQQRKKLEKEEKVLKATILQKLNAYSTASIGDFYISISKSKDNEGTVITQDMVGQTINARKGAIRLNIKESINND